MRINRKPLAKKFYLKVLQGNKVLLSTDSRFAKRFYNRASREIEKYSKKKGIHFYLKVCYGKEKTNLGEIMEFYNDAICHTKEEFDGLFKQFLNL